MTELITREQKHLLYKNELGYPFLLLKNMEIYRYDADTLRGLCWSKKVVTNLKKKCIITDVFETDDKLSIFEVQNEKLPALLATGIHKRRVSKNGLWLRNKEKRLGHKIIPFNPKLT